MFTGNRGCLVNDTEDVVRHHRGQLWITCLTEFRDWRVQLARPGRWTPIFFLDDAVALAAGHRPCGLCRREAYESYRESVTAADVLDRPLSAQDLNRRLASERLRRGRGLDRAVDRLLWSAEIDQLPVGTVVVDRDRNPQLLLEDRQFSFTFAGWNRPVRRPRIGVVQVLTPPTSVAALSNGYDPVLHQTASG
jgi:hypothetical protein